MARNEFTFPSADGKTQIHAVEWLPDGEVRAVLQISHGVSEYILKPVMPDELKEELIGMKHKLDEDIKDIENSKPYKIHHYASNKSKTYTQQFKDITNKYDIDLDDDWNKELLPHQGRHPNAYHEWILDQMRNIDSIANGNKYIFLELYESEIKNVIRENPDMLYSKYWKNLK